MIVTGLLFAIIALLVLYGSLKISTQQKTNADLSKTNEIKDRAIKSLEQNVKNLDGDKNAIAEELRRLGGNPSLIVFRRVAQRMREEGRLVLPSDNVSDSDGD